MATGYTASRHINGLGNAYVQDILFRAGIDPRRKVIQIDTGGRQDLHEAIQTVIAEATRLGGRDEESDLHGQPGRYIRRMDSRTAGQPCPTCRMAILKIAYLGGSCYICPNCQT